MAGRPLGGREGLGRSNGPAGLLPVPDPIARVVTNHGARAGWAEFAAGRASLAAYWGRGEWQHGAVVRVPTNNSLPRPFRSEPQSARWTVDAILRRSMAAAVTRASGNPGTIDRRLHLDGRPDLEGVACGWCNRL